MLLLIKSLLQNRANVEEVILRRLQDDDLSVILEALSINGLFEVMNPLCLFKAFHDIVVRCVGKLYGNFFRTWSFYLAKFSSAFHL